MSYKEEWEDCCGHCASHWMDKDIGWVCRNKDSDYYGCETDYGELCENFEQRSAAKNRNRMIGGYDTR